MIGNDFDLGLGLRTRCGDFIPRYLARRTKSTAIGKLKESIVRDPVLGSDAEFAFGRPYISKIEGCIHDGWLLIRYLTGFDPDYLYHLLSSSYLYGQFTVKASGSAVDNLNIDKVKAALIPLPPLAEQKRIVECVSKLLAVFDELK